MKWKSQDCTQTCLILKPAALYLVFQTGWGHLCLLSVPVQGSGQPLLPAWAGIVSLWPPPCLLQKNNGSCHGFNLLPDAPGSAASRLFVLKVWLAEEDARV
jgi:hypothetical protein